MPIIETPKNIKVPLHTRLWIEWKKVSKSGSGIVELKDIVFYGPIFSDCEKLDDKGFIYLDLTKHFLVLLPKPYFIKFEWEGVEVQDSNGAKLKKAYFLDDDLGLLNKITHKDKLLLDCSGHHSNDVKNGIYKPAFDAILYNEYNEPYKF